MAYFNLWKACKRKNKNNFKKRRKQRDNGFIGLGWVGGNKIRIIHE